MGIKGPEGLEVVHAEINMQTTNAPKQGINPLRFINGIETSS
jgi:hypothetical protein